MYNYRLKVIIDTRDTKGDYLQGFSVWVARTLLWTQHVIGAAEIEDVDGYYRISRSIPFSWRSQEMITVKKVNWAPNIMKTLSSYDQYLVYF